MKLCPKMHTIYYESLRDILHALDIKLIHTIITFHLMKLSSLCRDLNENVKYRLRSPEKTISVSVTLQLLPCVWCGTETKWISDLDSISKNT